MDMTRIEKVIEDMRKMNLEQFLVTDPMAIFYLTDKWLVPDSIMHVENV